MKSIYVTLVTALVRLIRKRSRLVNTWLPHESVISPKRVAFQTEQSSSLSSPQRFHSLANYTQQPRESFKPVAKIYSEREEVFAERKNPYLGRVRGLQSEGNEGKDKMKPN